MIKRLYSLPKLVGALAMCAVAAGAYAQTIKIGELNSYKTQPAFLGPYKMGMELAIEQINAAGGVNGKQLELIVRDDNSNPVDAVREVGEDGSLEVDLFVSDLRWLEQLVLRLAPSAQVKAPDSVRELARDSAHRALALYA